jgi:hypothetical protein
MDCVKDAVRIKELGMEMTSDRREWKKKTCCADPTLWDKGTMMMIQVSGVGTISFHHDV